MLPVPRNPQIHFCPRVSSTVLETNSTILKALTVTSIIIACLSKSLFVGSGAVAAVFTLVVLHLRADQAEAPIPTVPASPEIEQVVRRLITSEAVRNLLNKNRGLPTQITVTEEEIIDGLNRRISLRELPTTSKKAEQLLRLTGDSEPFTFIVTGEVLPQSFRPNNRVLSALLQGGDGIFGENVLSYLPVQELNRFARVSVDAAQFLTQDRACETIFSQLESLTEISVSQIQEYQQSFRVFLGRELNVLELLNLCPNLTDFDLSHSNINDVQLAAIVRAVPQLTAVNLAGCHQITDAGLACLGNCTSVNLAGCHLVTDAGLVHLGNCTSVNLNSCNLITDAGLAHLGNCTSVNLSFCGRITNAGLALLRSCLSIKLVNCGWVTDASLIYLERCTSVDLSHCYAITGTGLAALGNCITLKLRFCNLFTDAGLAYLERCRFIDLSNCYQITDRGLSHIGNCTTVKLSNCSLITDEGLSYLRNCLVADLGCCYGISDDGFVHLRKCTDVNLTGCLQIRGSGFIHLVNCTSINLKYCLYVSDEAKAVLRQRGTTVIE